MSMRVWFLKLIYCFNYFKVQFFYTSMHSYIIKGATKLYSIHYTLRGHYFVWYAFVGVCTFYQLFWKTSFFLSFWAFCLCVFCMFCVEFDVSFLIFHNHCLHSSSCQVFWSSLENYTSSNTRQHETMRVQHEKTWVQHDTTRNNTRQHEYNTTQHEYNTTQHEYKGSSSSKNRALTELYFF